MSRFLSDETAALEPYTPGEQPQDMKYNKLNTNESPFPPSPQVISALSAAAVSELNLYSDPTCARLCAAVAERNGLLPGQVIAGNGSDEILSFAYRAFCGEGKGIAFADITYGFYSVWARYYAVDAEIIPLRDDFSLSVDDYMDASGTILIANPNAPTGMALPKSEIRRLLERDRNRLVIVDEAYVDFGGESCAELINEFDNLLVVQTFSKSRSLAGGRIGFGMGSAGLISDLNRVKYSFNPYNVNRLSILAGEAAMGDEDYFRACTAAIADTREWTTGQLQALGFTVLPSKTNFVFAKNNRLPGADYYKKLKERGILVRHFDAPERIKDFCRITIGSREQMRSLIDETKKLLD